MIEKFNPDKTKYIKVVNMFLNLVHHEKKAHSRPDISKADSILIIDPTLIGDIVMLVPLLRAIRKNNNHCRITLACGKWAKSILRSQNLVDEFIFIDSNYLNSIKSLAIDRKRLKEQTRRINKKIYDYALEPRGDIRYIYFMHYCKAKRKVSYNYTGGECFLTDVIKPSSNVKHLVEDKIFFIEKCNCRINSDNDRYPRIDLSEGQKKKRNEFIKDNALTGKIIIGIHPGASLEKKRWDGFSEVVSAISKAIPDVFFVIFMGPGEEDAVRTVELVARDCGSQYLVSSTSIDDYMVRISACSIMICNDSGAGHLAAAYGVPVFVIFGPFFPDMVRPYAKENVFCFSEDVDCKPCMSQVCDRDRICLKIITAEKVTSSVVEYLKNNAE